jgi:hypothetical protein
VFVDDSLLVGHAALGFTGGTGFASAFAAAEVIGGFADAATVFLLESVDAVKVAGVMGRAVSHRVVGIMAATTALVSVNVVGQSVDNPLLSIFFGSFAASVVRPDKVWNLAGADAHVDPGVLELALEERIKVDVEVCADFEAVVRCHDRARE